MLNLPDLRKPGFFTKELDLRRIKTEFGNYLEKQTVGMTHGLYQAVLHNHFINKLFLFYGKHSDILLIIIKDYISFNV